MSIASNRAAAKLAAKRRGGHKTRYGGARPTPSVAPYAAAAALTGDDIGGIQNDIENAPSDAVLDLLAYLADDLERPREVTLHGECGECGSGATLTESIIIPGLAGIAGQLRGLREQLGCFDVRVLQRLIDRLGTGASLWWTGKGE